VAFKEYTVVLLDRDGFDIARDAGLPNLSEAKKKAKSLMADEWPTRSGTSHATLGSYKVEVRDAAGVCLWDAFR